MASKILRLCVYLIMGIGVFATILQALTDPWKLESYVVYGLLLWQANVMLKDGVER